MFALAYLIFFALYLLVSLIVVIFAVVWAGRYKRSRLLWGGLAALLMYNFVFWDWLPTVVMHDYYCEKEAGFWVYKTIEQWKAENPGVMDTLVANKNAPSKQELFDGGHERTDTYLLNDRFNWIVTLHDVSWLLPIIRTEQQVKDVEKNEVLARYVNFGTGNSVKNTVGSLRPLKFWLHNGHCIGGDRNQGLMYSFEHKIRGTEK